MLRVSKSLQRFFIKQALPRDQKDLLRDIGIISALPVTGQLLAGPEKDDLVPTPDDVVLSEKLEKLRKSLKG